MHNLPSQSSAMILQAAPNWRPNISPRAFAQPPRPSLFPSHPPINRLTTYLSFANRSPTMASRITPFLFRSCVRPAARIARPQARAFSVTAVRPSGTLHVVRDTLAHKCYQQLEAYQLELSFLSLNDGIECSKTVLCCSRLRPKLG